MSNNKQSSVESLIDKIRESEIECHNYLEIFHFMEHEGFFEQAKAMQQEQAQLYANYVVVSIEQGLPPITFNDWINLENNEQQ